MKNLDFEIAERTKLEEELATLQATADAATEQNEVRISVESSRVVLGKITPRC